MGERDLYELHLLRVIHEMPFETVSDVTMRSAAYLMAMWQFDHPTTEGRRNV